MSKGTATYNIDALKTKDAVMNGSKRMRANILARSNQNRGDEVDSVYPHEFSGMRGFLVTENGARWWIPVENVADIRFKDDS